MLNDELIDVLIPLMLCRVCVCFFGYTHSPKTVISIFTQILFLKIGDWYRNLAEHLLLLWSLIFCAFHLTREVKFEAHKNLSTNDLVSFFCTLEPLIYMLRGKKCTFSSELLLLFFCLTNRCNYSSMVFNSLYKNTHNNHNERKKNFEKNTTQNKTCVAVVLGQRCTCVRSNQNRSAVECEKYKNATQRHERSHSTANTLRQMPLSCLRISIFSFSFTHSVPVAILVSLSLFSSSFSCSRRLF